MTGPAVPDSDAGVDLGFSEAMWIAALHRHGASVGEGALAARIFQTRSGLLYVPSPLDRQAIRSKQRDPATAIAVARAAAQAHARRLHAHLGRPATPLELCLAHLAGAREGDALIAAAASSRPAGEIAPQAALTHPALFFDAARPRSVKALVATVQAALLRAGRRATTVAIGRPATGSDSKGWITVTVRSSAPSRLRQAGR